MEQALKAAAETVARLTEALGIVSFHFECGRDHIQYWGYDKDGNKVVDVWYSTDEGFINMLEGRK